MFFEEHFKPHVANIRLTRCELMFRYPSAQYWVDLFRTYYGPTVKAFAGLDAADAEALNNDLLQVIQQNNQSSDGEVMILPSEYLEVVIER